MKCPHCKGTGSVDVIGGLPDERLQDICLTCDGTGNLERRERNWWTPKPRKRTKNDTAH